MHSYFKKYNYQVKESGEVITFEGIYAADRGQAAAVTFYTFAGAAVCAALLGELVCAAAAAAATAAATSTAPACPSSSQLCCPATADML